MKTMSFSFVLGVALGVLSVAGCAGSDVSSDDFLAEESEVVADTNCGFETFCGVTKDVRVQFSTTKIIKDAVRVCMVKDRAEEAPRCVALKPDGPLATTNGGASMKAHFPRLSEGNYTATFADVASPEKTFGSGVKFEATPKGLEIANGDGTSCGFETHCDLRSDVMVKFSTTQTIVDSVRVCIVKDGPLEEAPPCKAFKVDGPLAKEGISLEVHFPKLARGPYTATFADMAKPEKTFGSGAKFTL
jgi:hypothetical protein